MGLKKKKRKEKERKKGKKKEQKTEIESYININNIHKKPLHYIKVMKMKKVIQFIKPPTNGTKLFPSLKRVILICFINITETIFFINKESQAAVSAKPFNPKMWLRNDLGIIPSIIPIPLGSGL